MRTEVEHTVERFLRLLKRLHLTKPDMLLAYSMRKFLMQMRTKSRRVLDAIFAHTWEEEES